MADATPPTGFFSKPPQPRPPASPLPPQGTPPSSPPPSSPPPLSPPPPWPEVSSAGPTAGETTDPHPWTRYFARSLDIVVGGFVLGFILGLLAPSVLKMPNAGLGFLILVIWIFVEAGLLATWGTTPGKWLLGTTVRTADGAKLSGGAALRRSFDVWLRGMGVGIPLISIFTMIKAHNRLKAEGRTLWDANGGLVVSHAPQKAWKIALAVLLVIFWVIVVAAGS